MVRYLVKVGVACFYVVECLVHLLNLPDIKKFVIDSNKKAAIADVQGSA